MNSGPLSQRSFSGTGLGELTQKKLHSRDQGATFLQTEDFAYNQHGQLVSLNNGSLKYNTENDLFGFLLVREQANALQTGNTPRYDGGISAVSWMVHNGANPQTPPERERSYRFAYDGLGRLNAATYAARLNPWEPWTLEQGAYDEKSIVYDGNGNILRVLRYTQDNATATPLVLDNLSFGYTGNRPDWVDDSGNPTRGFRDRFENIEYDYDSNGSLTRDANKGVTYRYNVLNKVDQQTVGTGSIATTYDASGTVLRKVTTAATVKTETYVDGFVYESSSTFSPSAAALRSVPTPEGRAVVVQATDAKLTYEYHLRDHLGNLRVAFRAQAGTEDLRLSSEGYPTPEQGPYPKFENVTVTQSQATGAYDGVTVAAVTNASGTPATPGHAAVPGGPAISVPVSNGDHLQVRVFCKTPYGVQSFRTSGVQPLPALPQVAVALAPTLVPTIAQPAPDGRPATQFAPSLQLSVTGLLSAWTAKSMAKETVVAAKPNPPFYTPRNAYLAWTLLNAQGQAVRSGAQVVPVTNDGLWNQVDLSLDIDLTSEDARTGTLRLQEINDGNQPVYFDLLTITHPKDQALVSQENHYCPFGMALSGVAVNTTAQPQVSKAQFNDGSELQDGLLGSEQGVYSTFYRNYDPATGRFQGVDPMAEKYAGDSPYSFGFNDPINFNDPNGDDPPQTYREAVNQMYGDGWYEQNGRGGTNADFYGSSAFGPGGGTFLPGTSSGGILSEGQLYQAAAVALGGQYANGQITISGTNYLGDGKGNVDKSTGMPWSYSISASQIPAMQQTWQSLYKSDLSTYYSATNSGRTGDANQLGAAFEAIFGRVVQQTPVLIPFNINRYNGPPFTGNGRNTVPDFIGNGIYLPAAQPPQFIAGGNWFELKAKNGGLYLSSNQYQVKGHIDNLASEFRNRIATSGFRPTLWLVTTADVRYSQAISNYALGQQVVYGHAYLEYRIVNSSYEFRFALPAGPGH